VGGATEAEAIAAWNRRAPSPTDGETLAKYHELLYAVATKHPDETRHETALRYIRNAERGTGQMEAAAALRSLSQGGTREDVIHGRCLNGVEPHSVVVMPNDNMPVEWRGNPRCTLTIHRDNYHD